MTPEQQRADSYGVVVPEGWISLPLEPEEFASFTADVRRRLEETPGWDRTATRRLDLLLSQLRNDLAVNRGSSAAIWAPAAEGPAGDARAFVVGLAVSKLPADDLLGNGLVVTADRLVAGMARAPEREDRHRVTDVSAPVKVTLDNAGEAVRLRRLYEREVSVVETIRFFTQSYLVPHDDGRSICILQFSTPNVEEVSILDELFGAIAHTLRIFGPDDPTDFGESLGEVAEG